MQEEYYKYLDSFENWSLHKTIILSMVEDRDLFERAIDIVEECHDTPRYSYSGTYNRHPLRVARILLEEFGIKDEKIILIGLFHDLKEWTEYEMEELQKEFGLDARRGVEALTWNDGDTWESFFKKIAQTGNEDLLLVKIADKLDNNRGVKFSHSKDEKLKAKEKTERIMRPFIENTYPEYWKKLEESLRELENCS